MLKEIDLAGALARIKDGSDKVCMIVPVSKDTTIEELMQAKGFALAEIRQDPEPNPEPNPEPKPEPKPKQDKPKKTIDHGKIIALHKAGWSASKIAPEVGCSLQTVINHINAEKEKTNA